jgi:predicted MFS family arabinose efflux permease
MRAVRNYAVVTAAYWSFTLTDGALRMLVLLHFHALGYSPVQLAFLFLFYEFFGVVTNLIGGWIASLMGLRVTLLSGLVLQVFALLMLSLLNPHWSRAVSVTYVMAAQALSGIAKDLTKMSSKSAIKTLVPANQDSSLFKWVALLTGSKNALKGVGFFLGGALLTVLGFRGSLWAMTGGLAIIFVGSAFSLPGEMGKAKSKSKLGQLLSKNRGVNVLSAARFFLFGARDIWFVVGVPVFLYSRLGWSFTATGSALAAWVIGYGVIQSAAPVLIRRWTHGRAPQGRSAQLLAFALATVMTLVAIGLVLGARPTITVLGGLGLFGIVFALNSSVHSYLILAYSEGDKVALNVGFYYMANAGGRLVGSLLSGVLYQVAGLGGCLWASAAFASAAGIIALLLPPVDSALSLDEAADVGGGD